MKEEDGWEMQRGIVLWPIKEGKVEVALPCSRFTSHCRLRPGAPSDMAISSLLCVVPPWGRAIHYQLHACHRQLCPELHSLYTSSNC